MHADPEPMAVTMLRNRLDAAGARYRVLVHAEMVNTAQDGVLHGLGSLEQTAPTLVLRTEQGYLAAIISGASRLSYKKLKQKTGLKNISMASPVEVQEVTGSEVGAVAMVNPGLRTLLDERLSAQHEIFGGTGIPRYSLAIHPVDLIAVTAAEVFNFTEARNP